MSSRTLLTAVFLFAGLDCSAASFIKTASRTLIVSTNSPAKGPVELTVKGSGEKYRAFATHRFEVSASGTARELSACGDPASEPVCMEIVIDDHRYHFPSFQSMYLGKEPPSIVYSNAGKRMPLYLPMSAGSIHSIEVLDKELRVTVFAQESLGARQENGRVMYGISHGGEYKTIVYRGAKSMRTTTLKEAPKP